MSVKQVGLEIKMSLANVGIFDRGGEAVDLSNYVIATRNGSNGVFSRPSVTTHYHGPYGDALERLPRKDYKDPNSELVWRTAYLFGERYKLRPAVTLDVFQSIPLRKGSGASAAARGATWAALSILYGVDMQDNGTLDMEAVIREVRQLEGHPDNIAPAIKGGYAYEYRRPDGSFAYPRHDPIPGHGELFVIPPFEKGSTDRIRPPVLAFKTDKAGAHRALYRGGMVFSETGSLDVTLGDIDRIATNLVDQLGDEVTMPEIIAKGEEIFAHLDNNFGVVRRNSGRRLASFGEHSINDETHVKARATFRPREGVNESAYGPYFYEDLVDLTNRVRQLGGYLRISGAGPNFAIAYNMRTTTEEQLDGIKDVVAQFWEARGYTRDQIGFYRTKVSESGLRIISDVDVKEKPVPIVPSTLAHWMSLEPMKVAALKVEV